MNHSEWAAARHSYRLGAAHRLLERNWKPDDKLPIPSWLPLLISDRVFASCQSCQELLEIKYGSAECTVCPLTDFVSRLENALNEPTRYAPERINS